MSGKLITGSRDWDYYSAYYSWVELGWLERNKFPYYKKKMNTMFQGSEEVFWLA